MKTYTINHHAHGVTIQGSIPVDDYLALIVLFRDIYGYHILTADISERLGVNTAITSEENIGPWRKALGMEEK